jgi:Fe-S-cluster containining protein
MAEKIPARYPLSMRSQLPVADQALIQIIDAALADTARKSGEWLACRPGCTQCCVDVFAINPLDVMRLQAGLAEVEKRDPARAARILKRARQARARLAADFPGDPRTGVLDESTEAEERFAEFGNEEVCPVLDPETRLCELYEARPMICRTFGPPVRSEGGLGVCELCYQGATDEEIAACETAVDTDHLESELVKKVEKAAGLRGRTIVAWALRKARG